MGITYNKQDFERAKEIAKHTLQQFSRLDENQLQEVRQYLTDEHPEKVETVKELSFTNGTVEDDISCTILLMREDELTALNRWADGNIDGYKAY